jgi:predicted ATPase
LGTIEVTLDGQPVTAFEYDKVRALLAYLAVEADRPHRRESLAGLLWPDRPEPNARKNLSQALSVLRQALGDHQASPSFLLITPQTLQFNPAGDYELDVTTFTTRLDACKTHDHSRLESCDWCLAQYQQSVALYRGNFLEGFSVGDSLAFEDWTILNRERLQRLFIETLSHLAHYHARRGQVEEALPYAWRQVALEPWQENGYRQLMRLLALNGQREAALAKYETYRRLLDEELGIEPAQETTRLYEQIRAGSLSRSAGEQGQVETAPMPPRLPLPPHKLPSQPTPFIGREGELAEITQRLTNPTCRLLTLIGPGGIGKTRLALEVGTRLLPGEAFPGGIYFVPLSALSSADFTISTLAETLKITFQGGEAPKTQLLNFLGELKQAMLLILDNFEQLADGADLLAAILRRAPAVKLLVTSRERLNLRNEWVLDIRGLSFPQSLQPGEALAGYSAAQLFLETATRLEATFALSEADIPHLARICQLVEGMPLGLELAAAWVRVLSCREIAQEIEKNLKFLTTPLQDVPARHRSMTAVFDHSWNRLSPEEQRVFRSLAVFRGGFSRDAAEQVAGASLPLLAALLDKSMLRRNDVGRYELHELLRQYAAEKLDKAGETGQVRSRHLAFFLKLVEEVEPKSHGVEQLTWLKWLNNENDNLRAALTWSLEGGAAETGLRLAAPLGWFWFLRGLYDEGIQWLDRVLSETDPTEQPAVRARAFHILGQTARFQGDDATARSACEQSLALYRTLEDWRGIADSLFILGDIAGYQGDDAAARSIFAAARSAYEKALVILRQQGDQWRMARSFNKMGEIARVEDDYPSARSFYEESLSIRRELDDQIGTALELGNLGVVALHQGHVRQAAAFSQEGLVLYRKHGVKRGMIDCLEVLAGVAGSAGQPTWAARLFGATQVLREAVGTCREYIDQIEYDRHVAVTRAKLDEATFAAAWAEGRAMTLEQAMDYALATKPDQFAEDAASVN